jgi:hypothetical protein
MGNSIGGAANSPRVITGEKAIKSALRIPRFNRNFRPKCILWQNSEGSITETRDLILSRYLRRFANISSAPLTPFCRSGMNLALEACLGVLDGLNALFGRKRS